MITSRLHNKWQKKLNEKKNPDKGVVINILPELMSFTLDIISLIAFGYDLNSIEKHSEFVDALLIFMPIIHKRITSIFPYWKLFYTSLDKKFVKGKKIVNDLVYQMISDFYDNQKNLKKSFIETILASREQTSDDDDNTDKLTDYEILGNVITLLLAGQDTTANSLAWSLYYLSRNHQIQEDLYNEVKYIEKSNLYYIPDKNEIEKLKLSSGVIKEVLRMKGPSVMMFLEPNFDTDLSYNDKSIRVKKGDSIFLLNRAILVDEKNYENPLHFIPQRWENESNDSKYSFLSGLPFGGGPRICPGRNLSLMESNIFLSMISHQFIVRPANSKNSNIDLSLAQTEDNSVKEHLAFTMGPEHLSLRIFPRKN